MPLDPQAKGLLDMMAAAGNPPLIDLPVADARASYLAMKALAGPEAAVASVEDRAVPGPDSEVPVRIYTPEGTGPFPLLVFFHGGGWVIGDLDSHDSQCRALCSGAGAVVAAVHYRLAPEHPFPAAPEDAYAATRWAAEHAAELNADPGRIAVGGDSAGGNLTAVVALMARDRGGPALRFQLMIYPVTNFDYGTASYRDNAEGYMLTRASMEWFWGHYLNDASDGAHPYASPLRAESLAGLPPAFVITAEFDPLRDEGEAYAERLRQAGVPVTLRRYDGMVHGFFQLAGALDQGKQVIADSCAALKAAFSG